MTKTNKSAASIGVNLGVLVLPWFLGACVQPSAGNVVQVNVAVQPPKTVPQAVPAVRSENSALQATLSVLRISDGAGCPKRDPVSFGVFLRSEREDEVLICYYD